MNLFRTKELESIESENQLKRCLNATDVTFMGVGAIIGAGIFVLLGERTALVGYPISHSQMCLKRKHCIIPTTQCFPFLIPHQSPFSPNTKEYPRPTVPLQTLLSISVLILRRQ